MGKINHKLISFSLALLVGKIAFAIDTTELILKDLGATREEIQLSYDLVSMVRGKTFQGICHTYSTPKSDWVKGALSVRSEFYFYTTSGIIKTLYFYYDKDCSNLADRVVAVHPYKALRRVQNRFQVEIKQELLIGRSGRYDVFEVDGQGINTTAEDIKGPLSEEELLKVPLNGNTYRVSNDLFGE